MEERKRDRGKMLSVHTPLIFGSAFTKEDLGLEKAHTHRHTHKSINMMLDPARK